MADHYKRPTFINNVKRIMALPCAFDGVLAVELAAEAFVKGFVDFLEPDFKEAYHHITGEPLVHSIRQGVKDLGEFLDTPETPVRRFLGKLLGIEDRVVWAYFIFSLINDGLIDASSQYLKMDPCGTGDRTGSGTRWISGIHDNGTYNSALFVFPNPGGPIKVAPAIVNLSHDNNYRGTVMANAVWGPLLGPPVGVQGRVVFYPGDGGEAVHVDSFSNAGKDGTATQDANLLFANYQAPHGRSGALVCEWAYSGPPLPSHQAFLKEGSTCFLS